MRWPKFKPKVRIFRRHARDVASTTLPRAHPAAAFSCALDKHGRRPILAALFSKPGVQLDIDVLAVNSRQAPKQRE